MADTPDGQWPGASDDSQRQQQQQRPRTSYTHSFLHSWRRVSRKKSLNDLGSFGNPPVGRPRTGSEALLSRPMLHAGLFSPDQPRTDSGLIAQSPLSSRDLSSRASGKRRTRSSFGNWVGSINDFRKDVGNKIKSRGHSSRKSVCVMDNADVTHADALPTRGTAAGKMQYEDEYYQPDEGSSIAGPRGRPLTAIPPYLTLPQRTISPSGGDGARAAAALARSTEKLRQLDICSGDAHSPVTRRPSNISDAESGIEVDLMSSSTTLVTEPRIAGHDPANLPPELFELTLTFLDAKSLLNAERVSKSWNRAAKSDHVWKYVFHNQYTVPAREAVDKREYTPAGGLGLGTERGPQQWKTMWRVRQQLQKRWQDGHAAAIYLEGHRDSVYCAQFDERKLITGSRDWTLRVWDANTLKCTHVLGVAKQSSPTHNSLESRRHLGKQPFTSLRPSRPRANPLHVVNGERHSGSVLCMQYDKEIMVTGSSDTTLIVWSMKDYSVLKRLRYHSMGVLDVCFNDKYIVACSKDQDISVWDRETLDFVKCLEGHSGPVNAVQMRGNLICSASGDGVAKLWDISTGLCIKEFQTPHTAPDTRSRGLACIEFTKDGRILAGGNDKTIYQFNTVTGSLEHRYDGHELLVRSLHYDAANDRLVSGSYDHSVKVYDLKTRELVCDFKDWTTSWQLSAKSDYRRIVATSQDARALVIDFGFALPGVELLQGDVR